MQFTYRRNEARQSTIYAFEITDQEILSAEFSKLDWLTITSPAITIADVAQNLEVVVRRLKEGRR